jgi:hypothetical protein
VSDRDRGRVTERQRQGEGEGEIGLGARQRKQVAGVADMPGERDGVEWDWEKEEEEEEERDRGRERGRVWERRRRSSFRIVHARGAIPNEVGPTHCRATPALTNQPTRSARPPERGVGGARKRERLLDTSTRESRSLAVSSNG